MTMPLTDALRQCRLPADLPFAPDALAIAAADPEAVPRWTPSAIHGYARYCGLPDGTAAHLEEFAAQRLANDSARQTVLTALFVTLYLSDRPCPPMPFPDAEDAALIPLVLAVSLGHLLPVLHRRWGGIPEDVTRATCRQAHDYWNTARQDTGTDTVFFNQLCWMKNYAIESLRYVRLGRFEFVRSIFYDKAAVWRNRRDGTLTLFAGDGIPVDRDGFGVTNRPDDSDFVRFTGYERRDGRIRGDRINPDGSAGAVVELTESEQECLLGPGMPVLSMHIPAGGGMTPDAVRDSFARAATFFPDRDHAPVVSSSWMFNPQLPEILPPGANLLALQKIVHLLPAASPRNSGLWFLFRDSATLPPDRLPRTTSLQRAVADFLLSGRRWRHGQMVYFCKTEKQRISY